MKSLKINSLKLYKNKLETYIADILETASESDIKRHYSRIKQKLKEI